MTLYVPSGRTKLHFLFHFGLYECKNILYTNNRFFQCCNSLKLLEMFKIIVINYLEMNLLH